MNRKQLIKAEDADKSMEDLYDKVVFAIKEHWSRRCSKETILNFKHSLIYKVLNDQESEIYLGIYKNFVLIDSPDHDDLRIRLDSLPIADLIAMLSEIDAGNVYVEDL